jgi:hypothetical protein
MKIKLLAIGILSLLVMGIMADGGLAQLSRDPFPPSARSADRITRLPGFRLPPGSASRDREFLRESFEKTQKDTARLYELATELKAEMEEATEDVLSITVMKKAEEIENLAEDIKNRMKNL